jgi:hypothetical protein
MAIKKGGRAVILNGSVLDALTRRKEQDGARGSLTSYVEFVLDGYAKGWIKQIDPKEVEMASRIAGIYEELTLLRRSLTHRQRDQIPITDEVGEHISDEGKSRRSQRRHLGK